MAASVVSDSRGLDLSFQSLVIKSASKYSEVVDHKIADKKQVICKDDDPKEYWDKFVVPFLEGDVLPTFLCDDKDEVISWFRKDVRRRGIEHWKKHEFDSLPRAELDSKWSYELPEHVISREMIKWRFSTCSMCEEAVDKKIADKKQVICKDDDSKEYWDKFVVPFLEGPFRPSFLCGDKDEVVSWFREDVKRRGIEHWKKHDFDSLPRTELDSKWSYGLPEQVILDELIKWTSRCSYGRTRLGLCSMCGSELIGEAINNHENVCHGHPHPHPDRCCACHAEDHEKAGSCYLCNKDYYHNGEDCTVLGVLKCGHMFHVDCIKAHVKKKNICPICKKKAIRPGCTKLSKRVESDRKRHKGDL